MDDVSPPARCAHRSREAMARGIELAREQERRGGVGECRGARALEGAGGECRSRELQGSRAIAAEPTCVRREAGQEEVGTQSTLECVRLQVS